MTACGKLLQPVLVDPFPIAKSQTPVVPVPWLLDVYSSILSPEPYFQMPTTRSTSSPRPPRIHRLIPPPLPPLPRPQASPASLTPPLPPA